MKSSSCLYLHWIHINRAIQEQSTELSPFKYCHGLHFDRLLETEDLQSGFQTVKMIFSCLASAINASASLFFWKPTVCLRSSSSWWSATTISLATSFDVPCPNRRRWDRGHCCSEHEITSAYWLVAWSDGFFKLYVGITSCVDVVEVYM